MPRKTLYRIVVRKSPGLHPKYFWIAHVYRGPMIIHVVAAQTQQDALAIGWDMLWKAAERNRSYA